jgi:hypothetical protein
LGKILSFLGGYFEKSFNKRFTDFDLLKRQHPTNNSLLKQRIKAEKALKQT